MIGRAASFVAACLLALPLAAQTPRVVKAIGHGPGGTAGLGDVLTLQVENFQALLDKAGSCSAIMLYIADKPVYGTKPSTCQPDQQLVHFLLDRDPDDDKSDAVWHLLLGKPKRYFRNVSVSVGPSDQLMYATSTRFNLFIIPRVMFYTFAVLLVASLAIFIHLCRKTSVIRSPVVLPPGHLAPYSLSRFQLAFWFFLVIAAYVFMWMVTGELDTISESILALIGIGTGTALAAAIIDSPPAADAPNTPPPNPSKGFIADVISDSNGNVSIQRFQMFVWTLVLGVIFLGSVYKSLSMPEFSATLLGLMGISSASYVGAKLPEKKNAQLAAAGDPSTVTATQTQPPAES